MTTHAIPAPITRTNATKDDRIWKRDSPINASRVNKGFFRPCSPPLKHITIQSTQELLDNFDPLDVLDSASERSASSADTMIMMSTEEERKNAQRIKNSLIHYETNRSQQERRLSPSSPSSPLRDFGKPAIGEFARRKNVPNNIAISCRDSTTFGTIDKQNVGKPSPQDDGYGTDSRSNTSASTSSPLSSSFSSLSTFEGSLNSIHSVGIPGNSFSGNPPVSPGSMQRNVILKGQNIVPGGGKGPGRGQVILAAKRREIPVEVKDTGSNLEDRLRALTTIEEEEFSHSNTGGGPDKKAIGRYTALNSNGKSSDSYSSRHQISPDDSLNTGFFRAVPVEIMSPTLSLQEEKSSRDERVLTISNHPTNRQEPPDTETQVKSSSQVGTDYWDDYTRYFEKHSNIPLHNIASSGHAKYLTPGSADNFQDKDINRQIGARWSNHSQRLDVESRHNDRRGLPEFYCQEPAGGNFPHQSGNSRMVEQNLSTRHFDSMMAGPRRADPSNILSSLPDLRPLEPLRGDSVVGPSSMPVSSYQDSNQINQTQHRYNQQFYRQDAYPSLQQQQQQQQQQHNHLSGIQHFYQNEPPFQPHELESQPCDQSHSRRTSRDEFLSLSRSLTKQYEQQREMLHQQNQHQHQQPSLPSESELNSLHAGNSSPYSQNYQEVLLRNSGRSSSTRSLSSGRYDRYSWQSGPPCQQTYDRESMNSEISNRVSLDLGSIPQLQKQIRATSEMCLQMSKKHKFASSADIYKLFQGQKRPDRSISGLPTDSSGNTNGRPAFHRHSFHSTPNSPWAGSLPTLNIQNTKDELIKSPRSVKHLLRSSSPATSLQGVSNTGPLRVDHSIAIPPNTRSSAPSDMPTLSVDNEAMLFQRQSSGYSSENELQQIESNARAARKLKVRDQRTATINPEQEFRPVNPLDRGSSTGVDDDSSVTDNEPVYVNQRMIAKTRLLAAEGIDKPSSMSDTPSPLLPKRAPINSHDASSAHSSSPLITLPYQPHQQSQLQVQQPQKLYTSAKQTQHGDTCPKHGTNEPVSQGDRITQRQVINLKNKPITIKSFVPSQSYSPIQGNDSDISSALFAQRNSMPTNVNPTFLQTTSPESPREINKKNCDSTRLNQSRTLRSGSSSSLQLSPVDIAQMLDVPFATSIISDETGDRLSTLV